MLHLHVGQAVTWGELCHQQRLNKELLQRRYAIAHSEFPCLFAVLHTAIVLPMCSRRLLFLGPLMVLPRKARQLQMEWL